MVELSIHAFQATLEEDGGGYPTTLATNESRIIFKGNIYICKVTIVATKGDGGKVVVRHFVPRDYTLKKVVADRYNNFALERMEMLYSTRPWKYEEVVMTTVARPENAISDVINFNGYGCDRLFHLRVRYLANNFTSELKIQFVCSFRSQTMPPRSLSRAET